MVAETHQRAEAVEPGRVLDLLVELTGGAPGDTLAALGLDDDLALFDLWDEVRDELGERALGSGDLDVDDLGPTTTLESLATELVEVLVRAGG